MPSKILDYIPKDAEVKRVNSRFNFILGYFYDEVVFKWQNKKYRAKLYEDDYFKLYIWNRRFINIHDIFNPAYSLFWEPLTDCKTYFKKPTGLGEPNTLRSLLVEAKERSFLTQESIREFLKSSNYPYFSVEYKEWYIKWEPILENLDINLEGITEEGVSNMLLKIKAYAGEELFQWRKKVIACEIILETLKK